MPKGLRDDHVGMSEPVRALRAEPPRSTESAITRDSRSELSDARDQRGVTMSRSRCGSPVAEHPPPVALSRRRPGHRHGACCAAQRSRTRRVVGRKIATGACDPADCAWWDTVWSSTLGVVAGWAITWAPYPDRHTLDKRSKMKLPPMRNEAKTAAASAELNAPRGEEPFEQRRADRQHDHDGDVRDEEEQHAFHGDPGLLGAGLTARDPKPTVAPRACKPERAGSCRSSARARAQDRASEPVRRVRAQRAPELAPKQTRAPRSRSAACAR